MKTIVFLYTGTKRSFQFEKVFNGQSAFDRALVWASKVDSAAEIVVLAAGANEQSVRGGVESFKSGESSSMLSVSVVVKECWTTSMLLHEMAARSEAAKADFAVYAWGDCPLLDVDLTREVTASHIKYLAEYTFADGYPYGFAPETIATGALAILASLADGVQKAVGDKSVCKTSLFDVMKGDVNSFEIETVIAPKDWRQLRLDFSCSTKATFLAAKRLFDGATGQNVPLTAQNLASFAENACEIQQTVPAFYNVQIEGKCTSSCKYCPYPAAHQKKYNCSANVSPLKMSLEQFKGLVAQIASFSDTATVGLGAWGEPLLNESLADYVEAVLSYEGLCVLIETDGTLVTPSLASTISSLVKNAKPRATGSSPVTWILSLDATEEQKYNALHGTTSSGLEKTPFAKAQDAVVTLESYFPGDVYPQFLRVNENEDSLEKFYRFWHNKESPSKGMLIIQKYDSFCGLLPDEKPADLSPLERNPCWHLKRDMTVLADGSVPFCREALLDGSAGNVFTDGIETVWARFKPLVAQQIEKNYNGRCGTCDEYYTFNF